MAENEKAISEEVNNSKKEKKTISKTKIVKAIQKKIKTEDIHLKQLDTCTVSDLQKLIDTGKKYSTVYADPPWKYSNQATRSATNKHYSTMTVEEIIALPIPEGRRDEILGKGDT